MPGLAATFVQEPPSVDIGLYLLSTIESLGRAIVVSMAIDGMPIVTRRLAPHHFPSHRCTVVVLLYHPDARQDR